MAMPICDNRVMDKPLAKIRGMRSMANAKASHIQIEPQRAPV